MVFRRFVLVYKQVQGLYYRTEKGGKEDWVRYML